MDLSDFVDQTLDGKYQMTRELGRGGMGTVYLATHLGTERPVAVKIISPQFMERVEFVERFRREARAAGRLRHPNVVNVTDFGFAETNQGQVAYLVMEYLDGCTLGEILDEEKNLPVGWTLDILEQVCSAVHEAHSQGIIHRDLKPDNIWLEPNQRGGYTVKVLDFGIAKLEEQDVPWASGEVPEHFLRSTHTNVGGAKTTFGGIDRDGTRVDDPGNTSVSDMVTVANTGEYRAVGSEAGTILIEPINSEGETAIFDDGDISADFRDPNGTNVADAESNGDSDPGAVSVSRSASASGSRQVKATTARSLSDSRGSAELTRVGAVLGTPLYMSPEQCRGEHLDPRSDIYSLAVIAYQMLSGRTPFEGDFKAVMLAHQNDEPPPLKSRKLRKKFRRAIHQALEKDPDKRPQTAEGFASELRSRSEGIFGLLRRSMTIYTEHLPKFVMTSAFLSVPMVVLTLTVLAFTYLKVSETLDDVTSDIAIGLSGFLLAIISPFCANLIIGTIGWIVTQYLAVPLRPVRLRPALAEARRKWKRFAGAGLLTAFLPIVMAGIAGAVGFGLFALIGLGIGSMIDRSGVAVPVGLAGAVIFGGIAFFVIYISCILVAPVVMMENRKVIDSIRRSRELIKRSFWTSFGAVCILFVLPMILAGSISYVVNVSARAFDPTLKSSSEAAKNRPGEELSPGSQSEPAGAPKAEDAPASGDEAQQPPQERKRRSGLAWMIGRRTLGFTGGRNMDMQTRVKMTALESINQILWLPVQILVFSFSAIIIALLYLKTRLAGGESMNDLIERFEDDGRPRKKWQERVRARLVQSGRISSNPSR